MVRSVLDRVRVVLLVCAVSVMALAVAGEAAAKVAQPKGGRYGGGIKIPHQVGDDRAIFSSFGFVVTRHPRRLRYSPQNACYDSRFPDHDPSYYPSHKARIGHSLTSKISHRKISSRLSFQDRRSRDIDDAYDLLLGFSLRLSGRFTSSTRAKGHLSMTVTITTVYPGTSTQVKMNGKPYAMDGTCKTGRVAWKVKRQ